MCVRMYSSSSVYFRRHWVPVINLPISYYHDHAGKKKLNKDWKETVTQVEAQVRGRTG